MFTETRDLHHVTETCPAGVHRVCDCQPHLKHVKHAWTDVTVFDCHVNPSVLVLSSSSSESVRLSWPRRRRTTSSRNRRSLPWTRAASGRRRAGRSSGSPTTTPTTTTMTRTDRTPPRRRRRTRRTRSWTSTKVRLISPDVRVDHKIIIKNSSSSSSSPSSSSQLCSMQGSTWRTASWPHTQHCCWAACVRGAR